MYSPSIVLFAWEALMQALWGSDTHDLRRSASGWPMPPPAPVGSWKWDRVGQVHWSYTLIKGNGLRAFNLQSPATCFQTSDLVEDHKCCQEVWALQKTAQFLIGLMSCNGNRISLFGLLLVATKWHKHWWCISIGQCLTQNGYLKFA